MPALAIAPAASGGLRVGPTGVARRGTLPAVRGAASLRRDASAWVGASHGALRPAPLRLAGTRGRTSIEVVRASAIVDVALSALPTGTQLFLGYALVALALRSASAPPLVLPPALVEAAASISAAASAAAAALRLPTATASAPDVLAAFRALAGLAGLFRRVLLGRIQAALRGLQSMAARALAPPPGAPGGVAAAWPAAASPAAPAGAGGPSPPREDAVLVFGATGKVGRMLIARLIASGRPVIAAVRDAAKAEQVLGMELNLPLVGATGERLNAAPLGPRAAAVFVESGVDVTDAAALEGNAGRLFAGASQACAVLGSVFGRLPGGGFGYFDNMTSERVDGSGLAHVAATAARHLPPAPAPALRTVLDFATPGVVENFGPLDDVIMGGRSSSVLRAATPSEAAAGAGAVFVGMLVVEGGGFCGTRSQPFALDLSRYDGLLLRVKGDGSRFKINLKTEDNASFSECTYQGGLDTVADTWADVRVPWSEFVPTRRARFDPSAPPLDPSRLRTLGLVYSRFEREGEPNARFHAGPFALQLAHVAAYAGPRPQIVALTSAGVERNAALPPGDEAARAKEIPIIQLNPGGVLNWKYQGEAAVRASGRTYRIVRPTGLVDVDAAGAAPAPAPLELGQGDALIGSVTRAEVALALHAALEVGGGEAGAGLDAAFEVRRLERPAAAAVAAGAGPPRVPHDLGPRLRALVPDAARGAAGLRPLPPWAPPPPPPTPEQMARIVADVRVRNSIAAGRGGNIRAEAPAGTAVMALDDSRTQVAGLVAAGQDAAAARAAARAGDATGEDGA